MTTKTERRRQSATGTTSRGLAGVKHTVEAIGPEQAYAYLASMPVNRSVSQNLVRRYARDMLMGNWQEAAGDPIRIDDNGDLIDGQHRLWAVAESGQRLRFVVHKGVPHEAIWVIDTGRARTLSDVLRMKGEVQSTALAGAIRLVASYFNTGVVRTEQSRGPTVNESLRVLDDHPGIREAVSAAYAVNRRLRGGHATWTALHYLFARVDVADAVHFFDKVESGDGEPIGSPMFELRKRLIADLGTSRKLTQLERTAIVIKAWNAFRHGESIKQLAWRGGGASPEAYPTPE